MSFGPYLYGWDDPVNRTDPSGLSPWGTVTIAEGLFIHALIEMNYVTNHPGSFPEYNPNAGTPAPDLYIDIADFTTGEIYEIKPEGEDPRPQLIAGITAMNIQHRRQRSWQPGRGYPNPSPQIISIWPEGLDPNYNAKSHGVWGIEIYLDYAGGVMYKGVPLSGKRRQPVTDAVPGYDPDAIEDFVQQRWPRIRRERWRNERIKGRIKPPPPYQNPLPGLGTEPSEPSTGICKMWLDDGSCIEYYQPGEVIPWWAWPFCPWIPEMPAPRVPVPRVPVLAP
jgi:hypothetical protein